MTSRERILAAMAELNEDELEVLSLVVEGMAKGLDVYGGLDLGTDQRDFEAEALEEVRDGLVYCGARLVRLRRAREKTR